MKKLLFTTTMFGLALLHFPLYAQPICKMESCPQFPDVTIASVTQESVPAPHCKVAGVIGPEIHFELLLPAKWNGKYVFGGGGGFVGSVANGAQVFFGALQMGYATVGTDTGHQANSLDGYSAYSGDSLLVSTVQTSPFV